MAHTIIVEGAPARHWPGFPRPVLDSDRRDPDAVELGLILADALNFMNTNRTYGL
jgi:hypothetical protein